MSRRRSTLPPELGAAVNVQHVYVHVPFCARRCVYCDFAITVRRNVPTDEYVHLLAREIAQRFPGEVRRAVRTIYLGGGTPSRLGADGVPRLIEVLSRRWVGAGEVTIEANPEDVTAAAVQAWRDAGINRLSLGVQSFDPSVLTWMHRTHRVDDVHRAVQVSRDAGLSQLSIDLIFGLPDDLGRDWARDLELAVSLDPDHISCYGLTVEPHTPLGRRRDRGDVREVADERYAREFLEAHRVLEAAGLQHYEVSSYARAGARAEHNSAYWRRVPYLGLGPSAHGFDGRERRWNLRDYTSWARALAGDDDPIDGAEQVTGESAAMERLFLDLRTAEGTPSDARDAEIVDLWTERGWAQRGNGVLCLTPEGWLRMNALVAALTTHRSRY